MANTPGLFEQLQVKEQKFEAIREIVLSSNKEAVQEPAAPQKPWDAVPADKLHPFTVHISEQLFQKMAYCWKRTSHQSAKSFLIEALEAACTKTLKDLGEDS